MTIAGAPGTTHRADKEAGRAWMLVAGTVSWMTFCVDAVIAGSVYVAALTRIRRASGR